MNANEREWFLRHSAAINPECTVHNIDALWIGIKDLVRAAHPTAVDVTGLPRCARTDMTQWDSSEST